MSISPSDNKFLSKTQNRLITSQVIRQATVGEFTVTCEGSSLGGKEKLQLPCGLAPSDKTCHFSVSRVELHFTLFAIFPVRPFHLIAIVFSISIASSFWTFCRLSSVSLPLSALQKLHLYPSNSKNTLPNTGLFRQSEGCFIYRYRGIERHAAALVISGAPTTDSMSVRLLCSRAGYFLRSLPHLAFPHSS